LPSALLFAVVAKLGWQGGRIAADLNVTLGHPIR
jgi:hypothetical protein